MAQATELNPLGLSRKVLARVNRPLQHSKTTAAKVDRVRKMAAAVGLILHEPAREAWTGKPCYGRYTVTLEGATGCAAQYYNLPTRSPKTKPFREARRPQEGVGKLGDQSIEELN
jgi:hypothetical protein